MNTVSGTVARITLCFQICRLRGLKGTVESFLCPG